jgi:hypothetical protein
MDWFERLTGFRETGPDAVRRRLVVEGEELVSLVNGRRAGIGRLEMPTLSSLRHRREALGLRPGETGSAALGSARGDIRRLLADPAQADALVQVASQFNLLEMVSPEVTPEDGVTRYAGDPTQGPACAIAAGAATIYRNHFVPVDARGTTEGMPLQRGQTRHRQLDGLVDLGEALGHRPDRPLWVWRNGYALCEAEGLARISERLAAADEAQRDVWRGALRIGLHWDVEVTDAATQPGPRVSQAFCSALPVAYGRPAPKAWAPFARLVLEAAYEATVSAAACRAAQGGSRRVLLTRLGGGVFGNDAAWIDAALERTLRLAAPWGLDMVMVSR